MDVVVVVVVPGLKWRPKASRSNLQKMDSTAFSMRPCENKQPTKNNLSDY